MGKVFLGTTEIGLAYLGTTLVYQAESPITDIPYIRGGDGSYIDTGITADNTTRVIVWARNFNPGGSGYTWLFGARDSYGTSGMYGLSLGANHQNGRALFTVGGSAYTSADFFNYISNYHKYELNSTGLYVDDVQVSAQAATTFTGSYNLYLFNDNDGGTPEQQSKMPVDICACKIYKNNVLVRDFTPVNSPSVGLYDAVSGNTFTNAGIGSFTYNTFNKNAYVPLSYVSLTQQQYIDTGLYGSSGLEAVVKFRVVGTSVSYADILGSFVSNVSGSYYLLELANSSYPNRYARFYNNTSTANEIYNNNSKRLTGRDVVFVRDSTSALLAENFATIGTKRTYTASSFTTSYPLFLGASNKGGTVSNMINGYIYYAGFGPYRNFVPAKVNNVAGLYDTYNDVFYGSATETPFVAGSEL